MRCIFCGHNTKVIDKRDNPESVRRRRECLNCHRRFTTYEKAEYPEIMVIKKDGRREGFLPEKISKGIKIACQKRPIGIETINQIVEEIETMVMNKGSREVPTTYIGRLVMNRLKKLDRVAYIRFASVYRSFEDIEEFEEEVKALKR